ncbi:MAG: hypothetical protein H0X04_10820 [Chthoniobacterales bacterium]|nr:hypothetical protein [Chthoniobacterales bacterium]
MINNEITNRIPSSGLPVIGGTFNTVIGVIFLVIVIVSPDGLMGLWDRAWSLAKRGGPPRETPGAQPAAEASSS